MTSNQSPHTLRIGIDIGGTFTDFVIFDPATGKISTFKLPSTPHDPSEAVLAGLKKIGLLSTVNSDPLSIDSEQSKLITSDCSLMTIIHGSTVATNALLERKGATTALITTRGFKDVIQIGRQNRPDLYDFATLPPEPLIPSKLRFELDERVDQFGKIVIPANEDEIDQLVANLQSSIPNLQSIAVVFLFSFANPKHEQIVTEKLRSAGYFVSPSHEILPEYREYERTSTTVVNAYVSPVLDRYLAKLETSLSPRHVKDTTAPISNLQIMQSNGGSISIPEARKSGVRCILSGPAGGVVGCQYIGETIQSSISNPQSPISNLKLLTFDMGGTSTDVSLIDGRPQITTEAEVGGLPIRVPVLDIHTIGAGGGSIATIDAGGALRVGPESAGADPGPACYGHGIVNRESRVAGENLTPQNSLLATVTDANLLLGRIPADRFLGGEMPLYPKLAETAISPLAAHLALSLTKTALGIIEIANAHMERALRVISVERGHDPRQFTLLSFGGAGSLHAANLARRLRIPRVLIPPYAATLSAFGMLAADVVKNYTQTVMLPGDIPITHLQSQIDHLLERAKNEIRTEGFTDECIRLEPALDMRYRGQSYELTIPFTERFCDDFHESHRQTYGYLRPEANLEIVNLRVQGVGLVASPKITAQPTASADPSPALINHRAVVMGGDQKIAIPFYQGESLRPGNIISGPAVVLRDDTTILIGESDSASVDPYLNLIIEIEN
jgi:N-methylhydantoinase A